MEFWEHSQSERQLAYNCRTLLLYIPHRPQKFSVSIMKNTWTTKGLSLHALHFGAVKHVTRGSHQRQMNLQPKYRVLRKKYFGYVSYVGNFATSDFGVGFPLHISYWRIDCAIHESSIQTNISMFYVLIDVTSFS